MDIRDLLCERRWRGAVSSTIIVRFGLFRRACVKMLLSNLIVDTLREGDLL
jgi:hypothetical protein